ARELQLRVQPLGEREEQARPDVVAAAGEDLAGARHATDVGVLLETQDAEATAGHQRGSREAVVACTDDDDVVVVGRVQGSSRITHAWSRAIAPVAPAQPGRGPSRNRSS